MKNKLTVLTYERVSTEEQTHTRSCDDQKAANDRYIAAQGWEVAPNGDYRDEGISGTKINRPGLQALLLRCEENKDIKAVVVTETNRLARNNMVYLVIREKLKAFGIKIVAITQLMVDDSPIGEMIGEILGAVSSLTIQDTKVKSMRALDEKARRGWYPSKAPLGYKNVNIGTEDRPERIIEVDDQIAPYVRLIPKLYNEGKSYKDIAKYLDNLGLVGNELGKVSANEVRLILFNDFYLGEFMWRGNKYQGKHPPLFNKFEIYQARNRSNEKGHIHQTEKLKEEFPFKKLPLYCYTCNCRITAEKKHKFYKRTNRSVIYELYHCTKSKGRSICQQPCINKNDLINEFVEKAVKPIDIDEKLAQFLFEEMNNEEAFKANERKKLLNAISMRLGQLETELRNLFEMYIANKLPSIDGKTSDVLYDEFRFKKENEREKLLSNQQKLLSESTEWKDKASNFFSLCIDATNRFLKAPEEKQVNFLRVITSNVFLDSKKLTIRHQFPFSELANRGAHLGVLRD